MNMATVQRPRPATAEQHVELPAGTLRLSVDVCAGELDSLIGFAARANPRRAFLFLSKVLGKHHPARPAAMEAVHALLAASVPVCNGPIVFIGMAETATGLGQGVFEAWRRSVAPERDAVYLQTTRYRIEDAPCLTFEESHSHAPRVFLHLPEDESLRARFEAASQVVLVDDELSTGNTFVNLVTVLRRVMPQLAAVHLTTICDFMGDERRSALALCMGLPTTVGAVVTGRWRFEANGREIVGSTAAQCADGEEVRLADMGYGRLGRDRCLHLPAALVASLVSESVCGPTLFLGTGEFMHAAFVLARALAKRGIETYVQATTRSPIQLWGDVRHSLTVPDPYGEGVPNYLYNVRAGQYARVLICHETPASDHLHELAQRLGGRLIRFTSNDHAEEIPVR